MAITGKFAVDSLELSLKQAALAAGISQVYPP